MDTDEDWPGKFDPRPAPWVTGTWPGDRISRRLVPTDRLTALDPGNGYRPPDWRWQLGLRSAAGDRVPRRWMDKWARGARAYAAHLRTEPDVSGLIRARTRVAPDYRPALLAVQEWFEPRPGLRWQVEARILAGQTADEIAQATPLYCPAAVEWYEKLFFDVRDRRAAVGYITHVAIRWDDPPDDGLDGRVMKFFAYNGGVAALDAVARSTPPGGWGSRPGPVPPAGAGGGAEPGTELERWLVRAAVLVHLVPADAATAPRLLELAARVRKAMGTGVRRAGGRPLPPAVEAVVGTLDRLTAPAAGAAGVV